MKTLGLGPTLAFFAVLLSACATSSSGDDTIADAPIEIRIAAVRLDDGGASSFTGEGTSNPPLGPLFFTAGGITFEDAGGRGSTDDVFRDGAIVADVAEAPGFEFVAAGLVEDESANGFFAFGTVGEATNVSDIPTGGSVAYTGNGVLNRATDAGSVTAEVATNVVANFSQGEVDVTLSGFSNIVDENDVPATLPFDSVRINDMTISGNSFSGGTLVVRNGATPVDPISAITDFESEGAFYGLDGSGGPDEVGGAFIAADFENTGDNLLGIYFAD